MVPKVNRAIAKPHYFEFALFVDPLYYSKVFALPHFLFKYVQFMFYYYAVDWRWSEEVGILQAGIFLTYDNVWSESRINKTPKEFETVLFQDQQQ